MTTPSQPAFVTGLLDRGAKVYEVGGGVRDRLLGEAESRADADCDLLVAGLTLEKIQQTLEKYGQVRAVGRSFGVIKFRPSDGGDVTYDIALPRRESSTGSGHRDFSVQSDPFLPVESDLGRRDFTINAMAVELGTDRLLDPLGGEADLRSRLLRQVSSRSFREDPLRILRGVQLAARLRLTVDEMTLERMKQDADLIRHVSAERITLELSKLLLAKRPSNGFRLMKEIGLLERVLPELQMLDGLRQPSRYHDADALEHTLRVVDAARSDSHLVNRGDRNLIWAALYHDVGKAHTMEKDSDTGRITFYNHAPVSADLAKKRLGDLHASVAGICGETVESLIRHHMFQLRADDSDRAVRRFVHRVGSENVEMQIDLKIADRQGGTRAGDIEDLLELRHRVREQRERTKPYEIGELAIGGKDILSLGIEPGPAVGKLLHSLREEVLDQPDLNQRDRLLSLARKLLADTDRKGGH